MIRRRPVPVPLLLAASCLLPAAVGAADHPIGGTTLVLRSRPAGTLVFVSKDPAAPFPTPGGPDDPATGTPGGLTVELFSQNEGASTLAAPAGEGRPGWRVRTGARRSFRWVNPLAPGGPSPLRLVVLKEGHLVRVVGAATGLPLAGPQGAVAIRLTMGTTRLCARFDAATIARDDAGRFVARAASAAALADCSDASLGAIACGDTDPQCDGGCPAGGVCGPSLDLLGCVCIASSSPCGDTSPVCNGACPAGETCTSFSGYPLNTCACIPTGSTPCGTPGLPVCGGVCSAGLECHAVFLPPISGGAPACGCTPPGPCGAGGADCPPGTACATAGTTSLCAPLTCPGTDPFPVCGGACYDGGVCEPLALGPGYCVCAPPP